MFLFALLGALNLLWSHALSRLGIHSAAYITLFCALFVFLGALASWDILR